MPDNLDSTLALIHWPSFGPYHVARFVACNSLVPVGMKLIGLATASQIKGRPWAVEKTHSMGISIETACPGRVYTEIPAYERVRATLSIVQRLRPKVIAINGYSMADSRALLLWCRKNGAIAILMTDSKADDAPRQFVKEWIKRTFVSLYQAAICAGTPHRQYLRQLGMKPEQIFDRYDVVNNELFAMLAAKVCERPSDFQHLCGLGDPRPFFLSSSRFIARKNLFTLLDAFALYRQKKQDGWRLVILGAGPDQQALEQYVLDERIPDVAFPGFRQMDELVAYYALAGAFVHPAMQEQWGLVINEAMACGLPVLSSRTVGAAYDLIDEGVNGFKFDPNNIKALEQLMHKISDMEPAQLADMGCASRDIISDWSPEYFARNFWAAASSDHQLTAVIPR